MLSWDCLASTYDDREPFKQVNSKCLTEAQAKEASLLASLLLLNQSNSGRLRSLVAKGQKQSDVKANKTSPGKRRWPRSECGFERMTAK